MPHLEVSSAAERDLRRIGAGAQLDRIERALKRLSEDAPNLDIRALTGHAPWLRLRVGEHRIVYRRLSATELDSFTETGRPVGAVSGYLIHRVVNRRDLEHAIGSL